MAFVKIYRGDKVLRVSESIYNSHYKNIGYRILDENRTKPAFDVDEVREKEIDVDTIPVSEMDSSQLREYARKHGIDLTGTRNAKDARKVIQKHIQESKM